MVLNKSQILGANDLKTEVVSVPEWGGDVIVRTLTGTEREQFENACGDTNRKATDIRARLCALSIVDDKGDRVFGEKDIEALGKKSITALIKVFDAAQKINGLTVTDDVVKNLEATPGEDSSTDQQVT